jgi:hypothetical protein
MMKIWACLLVGFAAGSVLASDEDLANKMINRETNGTWNVIPDKPGAKVIKVPGLPGEHAFRIKASKGQNPWDTQASSPIAGAINEGDVVLLQYYARAAEPAEGGSSLTARIQINAPPWTSVLETTAKIDGEWKPSCAFRTVTASIPEKQGSVSIHLATAKQVIELGPVFVFNFGKGYDKSTLGFCSG